jgi:hypothetical protein
VGDLLAIVARLEAKGGQPAGPVDVRHTIPRPRPAG